MRFAAPEAKIARTRIGSVTPTTNGSGSYNGGAESSIRVGARAAAVDERDDGGALSSRREGFFLQKIAACRQFSTARCTCPNKPAHCRLQGGRGGGRPYQFLMPSSKREPIGSLQTRIRPLGVAVSRVARSCFLSLHVGLRDDSLPTTIVVLRSSIWREVWWRTS